MFAGVFGHGRGMPLHRHLTREGARRLFPSLRGDVTTGAIRYYDGQVDDARLVVTLARTAASLGAAMVTSARAVGFLRQAREVVGVRVRDMEARPGDPDAEFEVRARTVIAATGVWSDDMSRMLGDVGVRPGFRVRASKGVHLVVPRIAITGEAGLILRTPTSVLFVIPWGGHWIIGTTDTDWELDRSHPAASARDIQYILDQVNPCWTGRCRRTTSRACTPACARCSPARPTPPPSCPASTRWSSRCWACCWSPAASTRRTG